MNRKQEYEFAELFEHVVNGTATEQQIAQLEEAIMTDSEALELYQDLSLQHSQLQMTQGSNAQMMTQSYRVNWPWKIAAIAAVLVLGAVLMAQFYQSKQDVETPSLAAITSTSLAQWGQCSLPTTSGVGLQQGSLELLHGTATLTFESGAIVSLEAPAEIELVSDMRAIVKHGRVVAEVPEKAIGFRLDTPDLEVKDLGTVFAVSVDRKGGTSQVDVIDGEVEVFHEQTEDRKLLQSNHRILAEEGGLDHLTDSKGEIVRQSDAAHDSTRWIISTADGEGDHATIISDHADTHLHPHLLQAKNSINGAYSRKFYLKFDLSELKGKIFKRAALRLTQMQSPFGYASFVPDCEFGVYVLRDEGMENWDAADLKWTHAPGNDPESGFKLKDEQVIEVGTFMIPRGQQEGECYLESDQLADALKQDKNGTLTLIVVRKTRELRYEGMVHTFAGNKTPSGDPPRLVIITE